jgi:cation:H+ antiporter
MKESVLLLLTGHGTWLPLASFALLGVAVFLVASRLARAADVIAETTGLGRAWIGMILLAAATSLPEVLTDVNAALLDAPDIGVGDLMGSTLANMLILAVLDLVYARRYLLQSVAVHHAVVGLLAIVLTTIAGVAIVAGGLGRIGFIGIETLVIAVVYLAGMRMVFLMTREAPDAMVAAVPRAPEPARREMRGAIAAFLAAGAGLAIVAPLLVVAAEAVSAESGLSQTFVGTLLVGFTTSFPEIAASVAAVRMGAVDLAVGNIFGSNAFNMLVLPMMDLAYVKGPVLAHVSSGHQLSALLAVLCIALGVMTILARLRERAGLVRFGSVLIVACYAAGVWLLGRA